MILLKDNKNDLKTFFDMFADKEIILNKNPILVKTATKSFVCYTINNKAYITMKLFKRIASCLEQ